MAGLLSFQPDEQIAQVLAIRDYEQAPYLVLATRNGLVKKTRLGDYNSPRQAGVIAINFREDDDELIGAELVNADDDLLLVSRKGQSIRFRADDAQLRPMGRATSGVTGHEVPRRRRAAVDVGDPRRAGGGRGGAPSPSAGESSGRDREPQYVFTITDGGFAKRTPDLASTACQSRGGLGIKAMKQDDDRGSLVGAFIVVDGDEVLAIKAVRPGHPQRRSTSISGRPAATPRVSSSSASTTVTRSPWWPAASERAEEIEEAVDEAVEAAGGRPGRPCGRTASSGASNRAEHGETASRSADDGRDPSSRPSEES